MFCSMSDFTHYFVIVHDITIRNNDHRISFYILTHSIILHMGRVLCNCAETVLCMKWVRNPLDKIGPVCFIDFIK